MGKHKRFLVIMLALLMSVMTLTAGCGKSEPEAEPQEEPTVEEQRTETSETSETSEESSEETSSAAEDDYDIMKSFVRSASQDSGHTQQYMYFNGFLLIMPNDNDIGFTGKGDHVDFFYIPGENAGFGGKLVTIKAYDPSDDSYKNLPSYQVAGDGTTVNKKFVAIFPTDLQCDPNDQTQMTKYKELSDYVHGIKEGNYDGPFVLPDSNPEP